MFDRTLCYIPPSTIVVAQIRQSRNSAPAMFARLKEVYFDSLYHLKRIGSFVLGGLLLMAVALMLLGGLLIYGATIDWPQAKGQLRTFELRPLDGHSLHRKIELEYQYSVGETEYTGRYLSPMSRPGKIPFWTVYRIQKRYRTGGAVDVIYDPGDPSASYLEAPDLFWDILLVPMYCGGLAVWLLYLFVKTRRRTVPASIAAQSESRFADRKKWLPVIESVVDRDYVILHGIAAYSAAGGLLAGWPQCRIALVASPNEFAVIPGPFTKRGVASSLFTLTLELSLRSFWLPAIHGTLFLVEMWRRGRNWKLLGGQRLSELMQNTDSIHLVSIDEATVYGYDPKSRRLWYRLPGSKSDEFIRFLPEDTDRGEELMAYIMLMQHADQTTEDQPSAQF